MHFGKGYIGRCHTVLMNSVINSSMKMMVVLGVTLMALNVAIMPAAIVSDIHARSDEKIRSASDGNILHVGGTGPDNYTTIQDAIDDADNGDTIMVYPGHYNESLVIKKSVQLYGREWKSTVIDGGARRVILIGSENVTIKNFTIRNMATTCEIIRAEGCDNLTIGNNLITSEGRNIGVNIIHSHNAYLYHNTIKHEMDDWLAEGIALGFSENCKLHHNTIERAITGIDVDCSKNASIYGNTVNHSHVGIWVMSEKNRIICNNIWSCATCGIKLMRDGNIVERNDVRGSSGCGIHVQGSSGNIIDVNNFIDNVKNAYVNGCGTIPPVNWWRRNYWSDHHCSSPKIIPGRMEYAYHRYIPWANVDWHPAPAPYE